MVFEEAFNYLGFRPHFGTSTKMFGSEFVLFYGDYFGPKPLCVQMLIHKIMLKDFGHLVIAVFISVQFLN